ncbi:hypothetical protein [Cohnella cellulosilytica]
MMYKDLHPGLDQLRELVSQLSCSDALFWCARINLALSSNGNESVQMQLFDMLTSSKEKYWLKKISRKLSKERKPIIFFFRGQILELMRWIVLFCHDHPNDGVTFDIEENRVIFFKCALIASDLWSNQTYGSILDDEKDISVAKEFARAPFRRALEAGKHAPELFITFGRGWNFYKKYFSKHFPTFHDDFMRDTQMTFEEYMICFSAFAVSFMDPLVNRIVFDINTVGDTTLIPEQIDKFVKMESQSLDELYGSLWNEKSDAEVTEITVGPLNTLSLRNKPIYSKPDGRSVILDPVFFHERVLVSPIFQLIRLNSFNHNEIFSAFGNAFEDYCCDILKRMYSTTTRENNLIRQKEYLRRDGQTLLQIDAAILREKTAVILEMKSSFLRESEINLDGVSYAEELRMKYSSTKKNGIEKVKGVGQLSRTIKHILKKNNDVLAKDFNEIQEIIPVLVGHDSLLDAPLTIELLREEFQILIEQDIGQINREGLLNIYSLTILTIDDLEYLEDSTQHFNIIDLLKDYSRSSTVDSLHNYIVGSKKYGYYANSHLVNTSSEILKKTRELLFNQTDY